MLGKTQNRQLLPERRRHFRLVTVRNFGWLTIAGLITFGAITVRSEMRGRNMTNYGRLLDRQVEVEAPQPKPAEVVEEAQTAREVSPPAQPMYIEEPFETTQMTAVPSVVTDVRPRPGDSRVAIVGGPEGVAIVQQTRKRPVLKGGFGRTSTD